MIKTEGTSHEGPFTLQEEGAGSHNISIISGAAGPFLIVIDAADFASTLLLGLRTGNVLVLHTIEEETVH